MDTKLCIDCKHFIVAGELCAKAMPAPDYVRGTPREPRRAQDTRMWSLASDCGHEARWFELKVAS